MPRVDPEIISKNFDSVRARLFNQERLKDEIAESLHDLMSKNGIQQKDLAKRLGVSKSRVTRMLRGSKNLTLETVADVFMALGRSAHLRLDSLFEDTALPVRDDSRRSNTRWDVRNYEPTQVVFDNAAQDEVPLLRWTGNDRAA